MSGGGKPRLCSSMINVFTPHSSFIIIPISRMRRRRHRKFNNLDVSPGSMAGAPLPPPWACGRGLLEKPPAEVQ